MTGTCFRCAASGAGTTRVGTLSPREGGDFPLWSCDACLPAAPDADYCFFVPAASRATGPRGLRLTESAPFPAPDPASCALTAEMTTPARVAGVLQSVGGEHQDLAGQRNRR